MSYEVAFEHYLEFVSKDIFEANQKKTLIAKRQTIDEVLLLHFLKETRRIKAVFKQYVGSFEALIEQMSEQNMEAYLCTPPTYPTKNTSMDSLRIEFLRTYGIELFEKSEKIISNDVTFETYSEGS